VVGYGRFSPFSPRFFYFFSWLDIDDLSTKYRSSLLVPSTTFALSRASEDMLRLIQKV